MGHYDEQREALENFVPVAVVPRPSTPPIAMEPPPLPPRPPAPPAPPLTTATPAPIPPAPVKSDGGSSSYYQVTIRRRDGATFTCETGDIIRVLVANDFDLGNIIKASRRISQALQGQGKDGTSINYDLNKIEYHLNEIRSFNHAIR